MYSIYFLEDSRNGEVKYVGRTKKNIQERLHDHLNKRSTGRQDKKGAWLRKIQVRPTIHLLQTLNTFEDSCAAEKYWIAFFKSQGFNLLNTAEGGEGAGSFKHSPKAIEKMKQGGIGKWKRPVHIKPIPKDIRRPVTVNSVLFESVSAAAKSLNLNRSTLHDVLNGTRQKTRNRLTVSYAVKES